MPPRAMRHSDLPPELNRITGAIVDAAGTVYAEVGAGLFERPYQFALEMELTARNLRWERQVAVPFFYRGRRLHPAFRADLVVEDAVVVELKACTPNLAVERAQMLTYLALTGLEVGLVMNFHAIPLSICRVVRPARDPRVRVSAVSHRADGGGE